MTRSVSPTLAETHRNTGGEGCTSLRSVPGQPEAAGGSLIMFDPLVSFDAITTDELNQALTTWGHRMGALNRPTPSIAHGLRHNGRLVAVTATDHLAAPVVAGFSRAEAFELSRVCAERPGLCRVVLRLWREFVFPAVCDARGASAAVSYQDAALHSGGLYRFDGWRRVAFSHSGKDTRSGRAGRDKWVWVWPATAEPIASRLERAA